MALAPLPDLENDRRVTRPDYKYSPKIPKLLLEEIVNLNVNIRFHPRVGPLLRSHYASLPRRFILIGQRIAVVIEDYGDRLQAEPEYPKIKDLFLKNINVNGPLRDVDERRFKNLLMLCFLPLSCDTNPPHDDWIMMSIAMTTEVIIEVLLSTASIANTEIVLKWMLEVLKPRRNNAFYVNYWLFYRWLENYKTLRDPQRVCCLLHDPEVLTFNQTDLHAAIDTPLLPSIPPGITHKMISSDNLKTILCPFPVPSSVYGSAIRSLRRDQRRGAPIKYVTAELLRSFVINRIPSQDYKQDLIKLMIHKEYTDFSRKPIGRTMDLYADAIAKTTSYKELLKKIKEKTELNSENFRPILTESILPLNTTVTSDLVMTVFLLTSDIVNEHLAKNNNWGAEHSLVSTGSCLAQTRLMCEEVQELLLNLPYSHPQIDDSTSFNIPKYKALSEIGCSTQYDASQNANPENLKSRKTQAQNKVATPFYIPREVAVNMGEQVHRGGSSAQSKSASQRAVAQRDILSQALQDVFGETGIGSENSGTNSGNQTTANVQRMNRASASQSQPKKRPAAATITFPPAAQSKTAKLTDEEVRAYSNQSAVTVTTHANNPCATSTEEATIIQTPQINSNTQEELELLNALEGLGETDLPLLTQQELDEVTSGPVTDEYLQYYEQLFGNAQQKTNK